MLSAFPESASLFDTDVQGWYVMFYGTIEFEQFRGARVHSPVEDEAPMRKQ